MQNTSLIHAGPAPWCRRRFHAAVALLATSLLLVPGVGRAQSKEYKVKAAFLLNFAQFVRWPASAFPDASSPLTIGVLGDDPFGGDLKAVTSGESVGGRKFAIKHGRKVEDLRGCQFIFISKSEAARVGEILAALQGTNTLTVGECDQFCGQGGIINLTLHGSTIGFEINSAAAQRAGLGVSSKLLKLGKIAAR